MHWFWVMGSSVTLIVAQKICVFSGRNIGNILVSWAIFLKSHPLIGPNRYFSDFHRFFPIFLPLFVSPLAKTRNFVNFFPKFSSMAPNPILPSTSFLSPSSSHYSYLIFQLPSRIYSSLRFREIALHKNRE